MRCQPSLGPLLREARLRHGLSQRRLALRAGTSQDAISRIERGRESPSFERFRDLLLVLGEVPELSVRPMEATREVEGAAALSPRDRLYESASWNLVATRLEIAGAEARRSGHPATRRQER